MLFEVTKNACAWVGWAIMFTCMRARVCVAVGTVFILCHCFRMWRVIKVFAPAASEYLCYRVKTLYVAKLFLKSGKFHERHCNTKQHRNDFIKGLSQRRKYVSHYCKAGIYKGFMRQTYTLRHTQMLCLGEGREVTRTSKYKKKTTYIIDWVWSPWSQTWLRVKSFQKLPKYKHAEKHWIIVLTVHLAMAYVVVS